MIVENIIKKYARLSVDNKQLFNNIMGSYIVKGSSIIVMLLTMPAYMRYFSNHEVLGLWFTLLSILTWILTFDLGIGNGLRNNLVKALVENNYIKAKKYISSAYGIIGIVSLVILCIGNIFIGLSNWNIILNIPESTISNDVLVTTMRLMFTGIVMQFFLKLIASILNALQKTALTNFLTLLSSILILIFVLLFNGDDISNNLISLATVNILTVNIPLLIATIVIFSTVLKDARPNLKYYQKEYALEVVKLGGAFFGVQISFMVISSTNEILITWLYGTEYVVEYQVYQRLFYLFVTIFSLITNPIWSAITKAYAEEKFAWILKTYKLLNVFAFVCSIGSLTLVLFMQKIVNVWLGDRAITVNYTTSIAFAVIVIVMLYIISVTCVANGIGELKSQLFFNTLAAVAKFPFAFILANYLDNWVSIIIVNIIIMIPAVFGQPFIIIKLLRRRIESAEEKNSIVHSG
ncbi:lipopolysaccharide biosynthesis protein [Chengkuizengella axinellae]|uniref:Polysaccharide biosynthesis protein n=1 Tax=Chengkuizengella axinellae TaxID=3064388 RepID=A0ABT9IZD0_9BACL|nr:hypothetical protein [Chengkuizengella sp. 2205SS18-9]MDP5274734.1 hypothetical protein [Chengkuizengella sp. 2205SS18-9]